ncbi:MAG: cytochrome c3 family protein [Pseudomonadales bacterium]
MTPVVKLVLLGGLLSFVWLFYTSTEAYQASQLPQRFQPRVAMTFAHNDHKNQKCVDCHHNFTDDSGQGLCLDCHLRQADISFKLEQQFHALCRGCHEENQHVGDDHGPIRSCVACHTADSKP